MSDRLVFPQLLSLTAAAVNWRQIYDGWQPPGSAAPPVNLPVPGEKLTQAMHLRWITHPLIGLPRRPFQVWVLPRAATKYGALAGALNLASGNIPVDWDGEPMALLEVDVTVPAGNSVYVQAFSLPGANGQIMGDADATAGTTTLRLMGDCISSLRVSGTGNITAIRGMTAYDFANLPEWKLVEWVGLPVDDTWAPVGYDTMKQGLVTAPLPPLDAAMYRLNTGGPPLGWFPLTDRMVAAPPWSPPDYAKYLKELLTGPMPPLHDTMAASSDPFSDIGFRQTRDLKTPAQQGGPGSGGLSGKPSTVNISPIATMLLAAGSDPFASLGLGYGTALPASVTGALNPQQPVTAVAANPGPVAYMVSLVIKVGNSNFELADFVILPNPPTPAPPSSVAAVLDHPIRPKVVDGPTSESVFVEWNRVTPAVFSDPRTVSYGVARFAPAPDPSAVLIAKRRSGGYAPFAPANRDDDTTAVHVRFSDGDLPKPTNPAASAYVYSVAGQDIFGRWTPWRSADYNFHPDQVQVPSILGVKLDVDLPSSGPSRPGTLTIDFSWNWSDRTLQKVDFAGALFVPPASPATIVPPAVASGFRKTLGGAFGPSITVTFTDASHPVCGAGDVSLAEEGPPQDVRRYRLKIHGFTLDFAGHQELAAVVYATGTEAKPPNLVSAQSAGKVGRVSSPEPPPPPPGHDHILWASLPDVGNISRAHLTWSAIPGAAGYFLYEASESALLSAASIIGPDLTQPWLTRLAVLRGLNMAAMRATYRRVRDTAITDLQYEAELPRGSRNIHTYILTAVSPSQVESGWPATGAGFTPVAAPRIAVPAQPTLAVVASLDTSFHPPKPIANISVQTRTGPKVTKLELYRVNRGEISTELDLMGPPISDSTKPGWALTMNAGAIASAAFTDSRVVPGWNRNFYRVVAWSSDNADLGEIAARSAPTNVFPLLVPPASPPTITGNTIAVREAGSTATNILISFATDAPAGATAAGPHVLTLIVTDPAAPAGTPPPSKTSLALNTTSLVPTVASIPPAAVDIGPVIRVGSGASIRYYAWIHRPVRASGTTPFRVTVQIADPLGRATQITQEVSWV